MKTRHFKLLTLSLFLSAFLALVLTVLDLMKVLVISFDLNEVYSETTLWEMIIKSFGSLGTIILSILLFSLYRNIRKGEIMKRSNAKALKIYGALMIYIGSTCAITIGLLSLNHMVDTARYLLLVIIGGCMSFFAFAFEIGIKMKEEQDLTI